MRYWYLLNSTMTLEWIKMPQSRGCAWIITIRNSQRIQRALKMADYALGTLGTRNALWLISIL